MELLDDKGNRVPGALWRGYWILSENGFGRRKVKRTGDPGWSPHAQKARAEVEAWLAGGPLPELWDVPEPERKAELILFPGGKDDAA